MSCTCWLCGPQQSRFICCEPGLGPRAAGCWLGHVATLQLSFASSPGTAVRCLPWPLAPPEQLSQPQARLSRLFVLFFSCNEGVLVQTAGAT